MTDERYVYNTDIRERRSAASGARAKKGGSRSKRCTLPSDHLTPAQKRKLNGQPETVNLNRPMTFAELKKLTPTMQFLYLDHLVTVHHARRVDLLEMLGIVSGTLFKLQKALPGNLQFNGKPRKQAPEWIAFLEGAQEAAQAQDAETQAPAPAEPEDAPVAATEPAPVEPEIIAGRFTVRSTRMGLIGTILRLIDDPEQTYTFTVNFTR